MIEILNDNAIAVTPYEKSIIDTVDDEEKTAMLAYLRTKATNKSAIKLPRSRMFIDGFLLGQEYAKMGVDIFK